MARTRTTPAEVPANPFTDDHYELCNSMQSCHAQATELYRRLQAAGFNTADIQAEIDQYVALATGTKQQFFPRRK